ncbi:deacetylvindoline O-acetyltransferase [Tanacetum coccineum]
MLTKVPRFSRRQLHTIVSRDIIKPSSPTPSHSSRYNLSLFDQISINSYTPIVAFYPRSSTVYQCSADKTLDLKKSLSQTLTQYYPLAGRMKRYNPTYVNCNDEGAEFIEACNDSSLSYFLQNSEHQDLDQLIPFLTMDQLIPNDLIWFDPNLKGHKDDVGLIVYKSGSRSYVMHGNAWHG